MTPGLRFIRSGDEGWRGGGHFQVRVREQVAELIGVALVVIY